MTTASPDDLPTYTTAEITQGFSVDAALTHVYVLTVWTDRRQSTTGRLTKGRAAARLVANTLPELLLDAATLIEQEDNGWQGFIEASARALIAPDTDPEPPVEGAVPLAAATDGPDMREATDTGVMSEQDAIKSATERQS